MLERLTQSEPFIELLRRLRDPGAPRVWADGMWGSAAPMLCAAIAGAANEQHTRGLPPAARTKNKSLPPVVVLVTAHLDQADDAAEDVELFAAAAGLADDAVALLPGWASRIDYADAADEVAAERLHICRRLRSETPPQIVIAPVQALMQPVPQPRELDRAALAIEVGLVVSPDTVAEWLTDHGFVRTDAIDMPGDFAVRGGILDIFPAGDIDPVRIDFFGDEIESIRTIDLDTQRSRDAIDGVELFGGAGEMAADQLTSLTTYLPDGSLLAFCEPEEISALGRAWMERLDDKATRGCYPVHTLLAPDDRLGQLMLARFATPGDGPAVKMNFQSLQRFQTAPHEAIIELADLAESHDVVVYCDNPAERDRLFELIDEHCDHRPGRLTTAIGFLHTGFSYPAGDFVLVGHHEIFHRYRARHRVKRVQAGRPIDSFLDLQPGDFVVHVTHGVAKFRGTKVLTKAAKTEEYLTLEFAGGALLHVPASQIQLVQKYVGTTRKRPQLSKMGSGAWKRKTQAVTEAVEDLAAEMLRIQAVRESQPGIACGPDSVMQREFEESFIYQETEDQLLTQREIKRDLTRTRPMDRLLCGDVGYGKTELAIRAAFKVIESGRQAAVLVPTTVLCEQHERTFAERFADWPITVESISRFKTARQAKDILRRVATGEVDILIGTHRILSKDVQFKDFGLAVIDEEQRFGVAHKEKLKSMRATVEVLTMTATPIPRTLHMAMLGLRDISSLTTPPMDRRSIHTEIVQFDAEQIRDAILREMGRDGQVYFVHNRVHNIQSVADRLAVIVPEAKIAIGHGQMPGRELEKVMLHVVRGDVDVFVCTTIIESGVDIPNVNTIFIHDADRFGLAELHQLRGRVGRYKHKAYCYLMLPEKRPASPIASRRLKAVEEYSELGAGFRIAMRDLEIRGAGNILGPEQSGHIAAVGYELYCQLLEKAVRRLRGEPAEPSADTHLELGIGGHVPKGYIASDRQRMEVYRRLSRCRGEAELASLSRDLIDAYGPLPRSVDNMLEQAQLRIRASACGIRAINVEPPDLIFSVADRAAAGAVLADAPGRVTVVDDETIYVRLREAYFEPPTLLAILRKLLPEAKPVASS